MLDRLRVQRRSVLVVGGLLAGVLVLLGIVAVAVRLGSGSPSRHVNAQPTVTSTRAPTSRSSTTALGAPGPSDAASWDAIAPIAPATSKSYPAIAAQARRDPDAFARAFAAELFTRDYTVGTRSQLIAWAQYEDAPLRSSQYPTADWTKVLVDSLTDITWDAADDTPIPADGPWLALQSERARQSVSDVKVSLDPQWEQQIASGYQPPDPLATVRDVSLTIKQRTSVGARSTVSTFSVELAVQLGTSTRRDGYGVATTNNYVIREVG